MRRNGKERAVVKRKDADWEELLGARDEHTKERCMEAYKEEVRKVKSCIYRSKGEVHKQEIVWKKVSTANGGKVESCSRIKKGK